MSKDSEKNVTSLEVTSPSQSNASLSSALVKERTRRIKEIFWDSLDRTSEERRLIFKLDIFILTWAGFTYFSKNLNSNNVSNAYVSGMKGDLNVVGNEYQTFTTMWTIGYVISQIPSQLICTRVRPSIWCPTWELLWVVVTFATSAVKTPHQMYACRFLVGLAEGTFYPAVHTVLGGWYTKRELAKRASIFFASAFIGSMFSGYLQAALYTGMNGTGGLAGWRWLFIFDGVITFPMALWGRFAQAYYALPDLPSNTRVHWLKPEEIKLARQRMIDAGKGEDIPVTWFGIKRVLGKWHFWVYTAYYTENIGSYMNLWLTSLKRYSVPEINNYPTATNAITIVTTLSYGWTSDALQLRSPIVYFSLTVCFFAAMNLAVWDGVPFGLKWASYYLTGFAQGSGPIFLTMVNEACASDSLERKFILGTTNSVAYAFNAWIPLITYNTTKAPRFLVGNSVTVALIVCAGLTLTLAVLLQRRDIRKTNKFENEDREGNLAGIPSHLPSIESTKSSGNGNEKIELDYLLDEFVESSILSYNESVELNSKTCLTEGVNFDSDAANSNAERWRDISSSQISEWRQSIVAHLRQSHREEQKKIKSKLGVKSGRGIVMAAGDHEAAFRARTNIRLLKSYNCTLPVEIFHFSNELTAPDKSLLEDLSNLGRSKKQQEENSGMKVTVRLVEGLEKGKEWKAFHIKGPAIQQSSFNEILYLDTDSYLLQNPEYLFEGKPWKETGLLLWPDFTKSHPTNPLWRLLGQECRSEYEGESGQILISRTLHQDLMWLVVYFAVHHEEFYHFMGGDRDSFRAAALLLGKKWAGPGRANAAAGVVVGDNDQGGGHTMLQADSEGKWLFVHANLIKYASFRRPLWSRIQRITEDRYASGTTYGDISPPNDKIGDGVKLHVDSTPRMVMTMSTFTESNENLVSVENWDMYEELKGFEERWFAFGGAH
ncbi:hypothetical protein B7494_g2423 [Chlorociboria aeruginascens]|nr:hypothetical protein B7494_g2423 [Chlorociboria aeruginascens]